MNDRDNNSVQKNSNIPSKKIYTWKWLLFFFPSIILLLLLSSRGVKEGHMHRISLQRNAEEKTMRDRKRNELS